MPSRLACLPGARYHRYTFSFADVGQTVVVDPGEVAGVFTLRLDGVLFSEVASWLGTAHSTLSSPYAAATSHTVCELKWKPSGVISNWKDFSPRRVGGLVQIGPAGGGCSTTTDWENPAIAFTNHDVSTTQVLSHSHSHISI